MSYLDHFHYQILGTQGKPRLVFLHGLMGAGANWRKITHFLKDDYEILIYDQRGHGRSFHPQEALYRPQDYADDLLQILQALGWEQIHLVGHSMGGRNAMNFAFRFPERVNKLVIEDIGPSKNTDAIAKNEHLLSLVPVPFKNKLEAREFFRGEFQRRHGKGALSDVLAMYFYTNIAENDQGEASWRFSLEGVKQSVVEGRQQERWEEWENLRGPVLLVRGENSEELLEPEYEKMLSSNSNVEGVVISQAGHWVHSDQPQKFGEVLRTFLLKVDENP